MTPLRRELIAAGLIVPGLARLTRLPPHGRPVLRLDDAGRDAARQHAKDGRLWAMPVDQFAFLSSKPTFGRKAKP